jgi:hypothetical protein
MLELPRTNPETDKSIYVTGAFSREGLVLAVKSKAKALAVHLNEQEVDDLIVMLQYAKKVVIEEGGVLD